MFCPTCDAAQPADNKFCEDCGARLGPAVSDRAEVVVSPALAAVTDRGTTKPRNEDRVAVADVNGAAVLVVCDGVSCSQTPHLAAEAAVAAIVAELRAATDDRAALSAAVKAADVAVRKIPFVADHPFDPPETTAVAAVCRGRQVTVVWVGDSRAYLIGPAGARLLTRDHNWRHAAVDSGELTEEQAAADPQARSLTRTVGGRSDPDEPATAIVGVAPGDRLVLCTDGVWDTMPDELWLPLVFDGDAREIAGRLVNTAKRNGTADNISAAVLMIG